MVKLKEKKLLLYLKFLYASTLPILIIVGNNTGGILGTLYDLKVTNIPNCHRTRLEKNCSFSDEIVPSITLGGEDLLLCLFYVHTENIWDFKRMLPYVSLLIDVVSSGTA